jgi:hypothetical protein
MNLRVWSLPKSSLLQNMSICNKHQHFACITKGGVITLYHLTIVNDTHLFVSVQRAKQFERDKLLEVCDGGLSRAADVALL